MATGIIADKNLADGILNGFDANGFLIVSMRYMPVFERIIGDEKDEKSVKEWRVSPGGARRVAAISAWQSTSPIYPTVGNA